MIKMGAIIMKYIYTDGSVANNRSSIGIYELCGTKEVMVFSDYAKTDNTDVTELLAILKALQLYSGTSEKMQILSDSMCAVDVINNKTFNKMKNSEFNNLVYQIKALHTKNISVFYTKRVNNKTAHKLAYIATCKGIIFNKTVEENIKDFVDYRNNAHILAAQQLDTKQIQKQINILTITVNELVISADKQSKQAADVYTKLIEFKKMLA